jgi:hypothetical protein
MLLLLAVGIPAIALGLVLLLMRMEKNIVIPTM